MGSTDPGGTRPAVPVESTVRALRRLAPGATLRTPRSPELRLLARALRECRPGELAGRHPGPVRRVVLAAQLRALDRAMTGLFGLEVRCPEAARLVRAARFSGTGRGGVPLARLLAEPGLRSAALGWAEVTGARILAAELRGEPAAVDAEDGRRAAELTVAALLPRAEVGDGGREVLLPWAGGPCCGLAGGGGLAGRPATCCGWSGDGGGAGQPPLCRGLAGGGGLAGRPSACGGQGDGGLCCGGAGDGGLAGRPSARGGWGDGGLAGRPATCCGWAGAHRACAGSVGADRGARPTAAGGRSACGSGGGFLEVRSVRAGARGFRVDIRADPPVDLVRDGLGLTLRALWWNGLGRVTDDLGHEYLLLAKDAAGTGVVRHWCHPRPAPGAAVLRLESAGYRGERLRLDSAARGTSAEVVVKLALTVRLGA